MAKKNKLAGDLLAALQRVGPVGPMEESVPAAPVARGGKAVQFWLHEEDRRQIRELAAYLSSQGVRPTDSLIVRAALRLVQADGKLVTAFREALAHDGRYRPRSRTEAGAS